MRPRVYVETTIPSFYYEVRTEPDMKDDPAIAEIREVRHRISERFGHEPRRIVAHYIELQKQYRNRLLPDDVEARSERTMWQPSTSRFEQATVVRESGATYSVEESDASDIPTAASAAEE